MYNDMNEGFAAKLMLTIYIPAIQE